MAQRVESGCRDCKKCTNSAYANFGRDSGRMLAFLMTAGGSEVVMGGTKNCRACGHKLSLHKSRDAVLVRDVDRPRKASPRKATASPGWFDDGSGRQRWWDGAQWGAYADGQERVMAPPSITPQTEPAPAVDLHARLAQLIELHAQGALTDEEFTEAKRQTLGLPPSLPGR